MVTSSWVAAGTWSVAPVLGDLEVVEGRNQDLDLIRWFGVNKNRSDNDKLTSSLEATLNLTLKQP